MVLDRRCVLDEIPSSLSGGLSFSILFLLQSLNGGLVSLDSQKGQSHLLIILGDILTRSGWRLDLNVPGVWSKVLGHLDLADFRTLAAILDRLVGQLVCILRCGRQGLIFVGPGKQVVLALAVGENR